MRINSFKRSHREPYGGKFGFAFEVDYVFDGVSGPVRKRKILFASARPVSQGEVDQYEWFTMEGLISDPTLVAELNQQYAKDMLKHPPQPFALEVDPFSDKAPEQKPSLPPVPVALPAGVGQRRPKGAWFEKAELVKRFFTGKDE